MIDFNPYREWLDIPVEGRRPDHYELLGLRQFEGDLDLIRSAADAKINTVRHIRPGTHLDLWQRILDELSETRRYLTDPVQKQRYDEQLRGNTSPDSAGTAPSSASAAAPAIEVERAAVSNPLPPSAPTSPASSTTANPPVVPYQPPLSSPAACDPISAFAAAAAGPPSSAPAQLGYYPPPPTAPYSAAFPGYPMPGALPPAPGMPPGSAYVMPGGYPPLAMAIPVAPAQPPSFPPGTVPGTVPATPPPYGIPPGSTPVGGIPTPADPMAPMPGFVTGAFGVAAPPWQYPAGAPPGAGLPLGGLPVGGLASGVTAVSGPTSPAADELLPASVSTSRRFFTRRRNQAGSLAVIGMVGAVLVLGLIMLLLDEMRRRNAAHQGERIAAGDSKSAPREDVSSASASEAPSPSSRHPKIVRRPHLDNDAEREPPNLTDDPPPDMPAKPEEKPETKEPTGTKPMPPEPDTKEPTTKPKPAADPKPEPTPPTPEPTPPPEPPKKPAPPVNEVAQMVSALNLAKTALGERRLEEAKAQIDIASNLAKAANHKAMTHRMGLLHHYVVEFWKAVRESLKTANMIDELELGNNLRVKVVEASEDKLTIRVMGQNRTYEVLELPRGLAIELAKRWLDAKSPVTKIILGAFDAVEQNGDLARTRRLWDEAKLLGGEVDELMPVLDDKFDIASLPATRATPRQGPMPTGETIAVAAKQVKEKFAKDIAAAKNKEQKYTLVKKLVDDAGLDMPNESYRYALLAEARDQCAAAKFAQLLIQVVDEMERWFKIDTLSVKYESLSKAAATTTPGNARDFAIEALALTEKAIADKRYDIAAKAAKVAHTTANRAKDRDLVVKAADKAREIGELTGKAAKPLEKTKPNGKAKPAPKAPAGKPNEKAPFVKPTA